MKKLLLALLLTSYVVLSQSEKRISVPEKDFEIFWNTFRDNYAFFKLKGVDWDATYKKFRPLITEKTKEKELFSVLEQMVEPLKDGHISISKKDEIVYKSKKTSQFKQEFKGIEKEFWQTVESSLNQNNFAKLQEIGPLFKEENLYYFTKTEDVGYIRITRCFANFESILDDSKEKEDIRLMLNLFDDLLNKVQNTKALIIDLRSNFGGHGGTELASRFIASKTLTHYKSIKKPGGYDNFSELEPQFIEPNTSIKYLKPIILLTSDRTASSAEDFVISLYKLNNTTIIGSNTSGMLSDMFEAKLSNKVTFTLSNQVYYSLEKEILEDRGIGANFEILNTKKDIETKNDPVITKAIEFINSKK